MQHFVENEKIIRPSNINGIFNLDIEMGSKSENMSLAFNEEKNTRRNSQK